MRRPHARGKTKGVVVDVGRRVGGNFLPPPPPPKKFLCGGREEEEREERPEMSSVKATLDAKLRGPQREGAKQLTGQACFYTTGRVLV